MDVKDLLDEIENELTREFEVNDKVETVRDKRLRDR